MVPIVGKTTNQTNLFRMAGLQLLFSLILSQRDLQLLSGTRGNLPVSFEGLSQISGSPDPPYPSRLKQAYLIGVLTALILNKMFKCLCL